MRSTLFTSLMVVVGSFVLFAEEAPEANLLFYLSFNKRDVRADYAQGNPESTTFKESLELRGVEGIEGPGFQIAAGERLDYEAKGNFDLRQGTISMWIKPVNWLPDNKRFEHFFVASQPGVFNFVLYKYTQPDDLRVYLVIGKRKFNAGTSAHEWRPGNWYKLDITWDNLALRIYVNGKMEGELTFPDDLVLPQVDEGTFTITPPEYWKPPHCNADDRTIVDEVKIYDRPLTPGEIKNAYYTAHNELEDDYRPPRVAVPLSQKEVKLEGGFQWPDWSDGVQMPIQATGGTGLASERQAQFFAKYDESNLYVAAWSTKYADLVATVKDRDTDMAKDDLYEIVLSPGGDAIYRFVMNRSNALLDSRNGDKSWNGDMRFTTSEDGRFIVECIIPFSAFGASAPKVGDRWGFNIIRRWADNDTASSWAFARGKEPKNDLGEIVFGGNISAVRLPRLGRLHEGDVDIIAYFCPPDEKADRVDVFTRHLADSGKLTGMQFEVESALPRPKQYRYRDMIEKAQSGLIRITAHSKTHDFDLLDYSLLFYARPPIAIDMTPITREKEIELAIDSHDAGPAWHDRIKEGKVTCRAILEEESAGQRIIEKTLPMEKAAAQSKLPCPDLTPGQYKLSVDLLDVEGDKKIGSAVHLTRPATPWADAHAGEEDTVPTPWTPVQTEGKAVRVWGREYLFGSGPFPERITSQGEPVLAAPIAIRVKVGETEEVFAPDKMQIVESKATQAVFAGSSRSKSLQLTWRTTVEFDGMLRSDFALSPIEKPVDVSSLALEIAVPNDHARFVLTPCLQKWENDRIELPFDRFVWLTGRRLGVCWFTESNANWVNPGSPSPIEIARDDAKTTLRLNIITKPTQIDKSIPYTMGIQATPAKPLPKDFRNLNLGGFGKIKYAKAQSICWGGGGLKQDAYLQVDDEDGFRKTLKRYNDAGVAACPYSCPTYMASENPIYGFYHSEWRNSEGHKYVGYTKGTLKYDLVAMCPASDYTNLLAWWVEDLSKNYPIGGIYFDCCSPEVCQNGYHGCGGRDAFGKALRTAPIFALRESLKRVYRILHKRNMILINHSHSRFLPPCHSFSDYWYPGEQYTAKLEQNIYYYTDDIDPEVWQSELNAAIKGVGICFLPEYGRGTPAKYRDDETKPSRSLLACCAVNDVPCSASWINDGEIEKLWGILDKFHVSDAEFIPHWSPGPICADKPLTASAYKGKNYLLLIVANLTKEPASGIVKVDAGALGIPAAHKITNEFDGKPVNQRLDGIKIDLPDRDYTILSIVW